MKFIVISATLFLSVTVQGQDARHSTVKSGQNQYQQESVSAASSYNGLTMEEIETLYPEAIITTSRNVMYGKNTYRTVKEKKVDGDKLVILLAASLKDQQIELTKIKQELEALKSKSSGK